MKGNQFVISSSALTAKLYFTDCSIEKSSSEKILGVITDTKLNLIGYVPNLCNKVIVKIQALAKIVF